MNFDQKGIQMHYSHKSERTLFVRPTNINLRGYFGYSFFKDFGHSLYGSPCPQLVITRQWMNGTSMEEQYLLFLFLVWTLCASRCTVLFHYLKKTQPLENTSLVMKTFKNISNTLNCYFVLSLHFFHSFFKPALQRRCKGYMFVTTVLPGEHLQPRSQQGGVGTRLQRN